MSHVYNSFMKETTMKKLLIALGIATISLAACNSGGSSNNNNDDTSSQYKDDYAYALVFNPSNVTVPVESSAYTKFSLRTNNPGTIATEFVVYFTNSNESAVDVQPTRCIFYANDYLDCYMSVIRLHKTESPVIITPIIPEGYDFTSVQSLTVN